MLDNLLQAALQAKNKAYAPYSNFRVGAALLTADHHIYSASNVENSSYGLTVCAERIAVFKAVNEGATIFTDLVLVADKPYTYPCGACLQVLSEFSSDLTVWVLDAEGSLQSHKLKELIPKAFVLE